MKLPTILKSMRSLNNQNLNKNLRKNLKKVNKQPNNRRLSKNRNPLLMRPLLDMRRKFNQLNLLCQPQKLLKSLNLLKKAVRTVMTKNHLHQLKLKVSEEPKLHLKTSKKSKNKNKKSKKKLKKLKLQKQLQ